MATPAAKSGVQTSTAVPQKGPEASFPPFDQTSFSAQLIWLAITFGFLYVALSKFLLPRITDVIDLTRRGRTKWLEGATRAPRRPERLHCPMRGGVETQPDDVVQCMVVALQWGIDALSYPGNVLLVHCRSGERRSTSLVYGILRAGGWSRAQALRALEDRPRADPRYADDAERALRRVVVKRA